MSTPTPSSAGIGSSPALPDYSISFADAVRRGFRRYVTFNGRAGRAEFWYWYLFVVGVLLVLLVPAAAIGSATASPDGSIGPVFVVSLVAGGLFYAAVLLPTIAVACRRLHDAGFTGLFLLLALVTALIPLIMCMLPTSPNAVRYGPPGTPGPPVLPPSGYAPTAGYQPQQGYSPQQAHPTAQGYGQQPYGEPAYGQQPDEPRRG